MRQHTSLARRSIVAASLALFAALVLAACATGGGHSGGSGGKYKIVLSLNQIAISQRAQGVNGAKHVAATKLKDKVNLDVAVSGDTVSDQIASLQQVIRQKPDAIVVIASSPSALTQVLNQACDAGIVVVNVDQLAKGVKCAYQRTYPSPQNGADMARFMCAELHKSGKILLDQAIAGLPGPDAEDKGVQDTLAKECPGVTVAAKFQSGYAEGTELTAVSAALAANPDVDGIISLAYCTSDVKALDRAGHAIVPLACGGVNGNAVVCAERKIPCFLRNNPSLAQSIAIETALKILQGKKEPKFASVFDGNYVMNASADFGAKEPVTVAKEGVDYFPDANAGLILPVTTDDFGITPEIAMGG